MMRTHWPTFSLLGLALGLAPAALPFQDPPVVFKSDVSLVRVDVQVVSSTNQIISGLRREDFELRESGRPRDIVNFGRENLPLDLVLLLDVSGSMRPHVERIADAAHQALRVLGNDDRVAILVFDRRTRTSMPFQSNHDEIVRGFEQLLDRERFNGGTDITRAMYDAADYLKRNARRDARRGIVILTDDRTEFDRDDLGVGRALEDNNVVLSAILTPDAIGQGRGGNIPTTSRRGGGGMGRPGGLGGIILGGGGIPGTRRVPGGGNGPVVIGGRGGLRSAGTAEIARASGGDSMTVDNASALEDTLARIRQSYALYFNAPEGVRSGEKRSVEVVLSTSAARRYPNAQLLYRSSYSVVEGASTSGPIRSADDPPSTVSRRAPEPATDDEAPPPPRRRPAVNEPGSTSPPAAASTPAPEEEKKGGFRRLKPGEKP